MLYEYCKNPTTGEAAPMTGRKLRDGWTPCDAEGNTDDTPVTAEKPARKKREAKVKVKDHVAGAPLQVQGEGEGEGEGEDEGEGSDRE